MGRAPRNWESVKRIVAEAIELPADERDTYILTQAGDDPSVRDDARALVHAAARTTGVLSPSLDSWVGLGATPLPSLEGQTFGRYTLERLIAEGASSAVYLATQRSPQRRVAIKILRAPLPLIDLSGRFAREAAALARITHANVARIYEAGVHRSAAGARLPYIAMEYVDGLPITEALRRRSASVEQIVSTMIRVAAGVHAAHQQAVIHRDLKPANVLVDATGEPRVLDFGIARIIDEVDPHGAWQTTAGSLLGTPAYMSPEQAAGRSDEIDIRTDVWSLGVMLYELLTGTLPVDVTGLPLAQALRRIETADPFATARVPAVLRGDVGLIVATAMAREKSRRYASAQALADDLTRYLAGEPIAARRPTVRYRLTKFAGRHRVSLGVTLAFVALLAIGGVTIVQAYWRAERERERAQAVSTILGDLIRAGDPHYGAAALTLVEVLDSAEARLDAMPALPTGIEAGVRGALGEMHFGRGDYPRARRLFERAISLRKAAGSRAGDIERLTDEVRLAVVLRWLRETDAARELASRVHEEAVAHLGEGAVVTLIAAETLAGCRSDAHDLEGAEAAYREVLERCRRSLGPSHNQTLVTLSNLATVLSDRGKYDEAEALYREALDRRRAQSASETRDIIVLRGNIARLKAETGRLEEAIGELRVIIVDARRVLGEAHDETLGARSSLAEYLRRAGDADAALAEWRELLALRVAALGWSHETTLEECLNISALLLRLKRHDEALELAQRGAAAAEEALGPSAVATLRQRQNIAAALAGLGEGQQARAIYRDVVEGLERELGPSHAYALVARSNYGLCLVDLGEGDAAVDVLEPALATARDVGFSSMVPTLRRNLGRALMLTGRLDEAEGHLLWAWDACRERGERENATRIAAALAELYDGRGSAEAAALWRERAQAEQR